MHRFRITTIDFTPNPVRRHTRGRRGKDHEGVTDLQNEFEIEHVDTYSARTIGMSKTRLKEIRVKAHRYRMRGFRGKAKGETPEERREFAYSKARSTRIARMQENVPPKLRPLFSKPSSSTTKFDARKALSRFKRIGEVPDVSVEFLKANSAGIGAKNLARMISKMLLMSGIESNPGPFDSIEDCSNAGLRIVGEKVRIKNRFVYKCPKCSATLWNTRGSVGYHHLSDEKTCPVDCVTETCSTTNVPLAQSDQVCEALASAHSPRVPPIVVKEVGSGRAEPSHLEVVLPLKGHRCDIEDEAAVMSRLVKKTVLPLELGRGSCLPPYAGEKRILTNRNVLEVKAPLELRYFDYSTKTWSIDRLRLCLGLFYAAYWPIMVACGCPFVIASIASIMSLLLIVTWSGNIHRFEQYFCVNYSPHIVSTIVSEYDAGTNDVAVLSTIRMKMRRLSALPLGQEDHLSIIAGSELMCLQLISKSPFFWARAASFRQPEPTLI